VSLLTTQQREALDAYYELTNQHPQLVTGRQRRPILLDRQLLERYAVEHNCVLGVAAATAYSYFVVDLVESIDAKGNKHQHQYQRLIDRGQLAGGTNSVVVATIANPALGRLGDIVLVEQERHATGKMASGMPRGFGRPELSGEENALNELREETGYLGEKAMRLATAYVDDGLTDGKAAFYHVPIIGVQPSAPETGEAIIGTRLLSLEAVWQEILAGHIQDSFTIQALALFEKRADR
jgi:ADP-ribose pyrophosphatase